VHFPGGMKTAIADTNSKWLRAVPLLPQHLQDASAHAPLFTVKRFSSKSGANLGQKIHVRMHSDLYAKNSTQQVDFDLYVEPQSLGYSNWGWPIAPEPANHKANLQHQILVRQRQQHQQQHKQQQQV